MQFEKLKNINFYTSESNPSKIFAEYTFMSDDGENRKITKLVEVNDPVFASYLRLLVIPNLNEDCSASDIVSEIVDYNRVYGISDEISVHVRSAGKLSDGLVEYALYNQSGEYVAISPTGYEITTNPKNKFIQRVSNSAQIKPNSSERTLLALLKPYVRATNDMLILLAVWLVQSFCQGNHSALIIKADAGAGKSTLTKFLRQIIDPSTLTVGMMHNKTDYLLATLSNAYLVAFDNMRDLSTEASDVLCVAITGGTFTKREAYTTNSLAVFDLHNVIILNGIDISPSESDLAQRCLCIELNKPDSNEKSSDSFIKDSFANDLPLILDAIFTTISRAMGYIHDIHPQKKPRMLEAYKEMLAIALALGVDEADFETLYFNNIELINKMRTNTDLFFAIQEFMDNQKGRSFEGTVAKVYAAVRNNYSGNKSALPGSASQFSRKIKSEYAALLSAGFTVNIDDTYSDGTHIKIIKNQNA